MLNIIKNGNIVSPSGASLIFRKDYINETLQTNDQSYLPYEIIITDEPEDPISANQVVMDGNPQTSVQNTIVNLQNTLETTTEYLNNTITESVENLSKTILNISANTNKLLLVGIQENSTNDKAFYKNSDNIYMSGTGELYATKTHGAVWNDYAEYRSSNDVIEPGYCVASSNNGKVYKTTEILQCCDGIVSDTFGFAIGETDTCKTPLAVAGRVLAYTYDDRDSFNAGDVVCAGPEGKIVKMSREQIREWPDRIVGIVSEIPDYETWGSGNIKVDGRIWIKVK